MHYVRIFMKAYNLFKLYSLNNIDKTLLHNLMTASDKNKLTKEMIHDNIMTMLIAVCKVFLYLIVYK